MLWGGIQSEDGALTIIGFLLSIGGGMRLLVLAIYTAARGPVGDEADEAKPTAEPTPTPALPYTHSHPERSAPGSGVLGFRRVNPVSGPQER